MNFLRTTAGQPVGSDRGRGSDATPVRLPPRAQAMQNNALKVQNSIREKYGWQQQPEELRATRTNSNNPRPTGYGQPNSLKRALGLQEEPVPDGRFGMIPKPQSLNSMQAPANSQQAGLIPRSPHLMNKNLNDMNGNSLGQNKMSGFRHVRISSDEFNIHDPLHTGIASPSNRGPSHAVQLFNHKIAMANGGNFADQRHQDHVRRVPEYVHHPPQAQQLTSNILRQTSSSDDEDDRMTDMNEDNGARQRLVNQGQPSAVLSRPVGGTAAHAVPSSLPQQRPFNHHKHLDAKDELKERFKVNILRMSKQAPDSEVSASDVVDFSVMEYLNRPAADQEDQMALIFRPQMQGNDVAGLRKRGETESVLQEETTAFMNLTENRTQDKRPSVHTESKQGLPQHGLGRRVLEDARKSHQIEAASGRRDSGDVLVLKRNNQASKNAPTLNSDEMLDVPGFEFKDEMTVLEMQEAEDADQNQTGSWDNAEQVQANHLQAEAESQSFNEFNGLHNLDKSKCSKNKSFNDPDGDVQEQAAEDDENDDEILNYSKFSQSKPSNKRNEQMADAKDASKELKDSQRVPTQEIANSSKLDSDPYGLNDRVDSSFLDSKLELKDQEPAGSNKVKNDQKHGAISEKHRPKHVSSSFVDTQLKPEVEQQLYTAKTNKSNVELQLSGRDLVKSGVVLSSPFLLSQDLASDLQVAEGAAAADFEARPEVDDNAQHEEGHEDHASQSKPRSATNVKSENSKDPASKKGSQQELSDLSIIASQKSQLKSLKQVNVNGDAEIKRKYSKIQQKLEAQRDSAEERPRLSNVSDDTSCTAMAPKIEGHCQESDPSSNSHLHKNAAPGEGALGKALLSGEVSMISNNDNVKSTEWNNLKDLNDNPESTNTQRDSNAIKASVQAPFHQQQEAEEIIEENKEEDQAHVDSQIQLSRQHASQVNFEQTQPDQEQGKRLNLNIDCLPSERSQANPADYKKFVYSPREQFSLQESKKNQIAERNEQERQAPERQASSSSQSMQDPMPRRAQLADRPRNQQNETKDSLKLVLLGDEGAGKTSIAKHLRQGRQAHGPDDDIAVLVNGTPLKIKLLEWKRLDAPAAEQIVNVDGVFVLFDVSDKRTLESARNNIETIRERTNLPLICLAHKFDAIIEMSDKEMAEKGVSEAALAQFSSENSVKVIKTSMRLPRLLDESFQLMLAQATGAKGLPPILNPPTSLTNDATRPNETSVPGIQKAFVKEEAQETAAGAQQNELDLAAQNIANIQINTQPLQSNEDLGLQTFLESKRERQGGDEDALLEEKDPVAHHELEIEQAQKREMKAMNVAMWERRDSKTKPEVKKQVHEITVKAVGRVAATARSAQRRKERSAGRHSIYEHLLSQQVLKQKPSKNKLKTKTGSVASLSLLVNHSGIQKAADAAEGQSPEVNQILGDISLEHRVKEKQKLLKTHKKSLNGAGSRKNSASRGLNGNEEQDQQANTNSQRTDVPGKPIKKKVKRKTYKGIFDTTQRLTKKRHSTQAILDKQAGRGDEKVRDNSSNNSDAIKLNHQRFNQLICQDIAKTRERLKGRQGRMSGPSSEQNTPVKNRSRLTQLHIARRGDLLNEDLAEDGAQNQDDRCFDRQYCQTAAVPKSQTEAKKNTLDFNKNVLQDEDACSPLLPATGPAAEVKDAQSAKTRTRYLDDAKAYVNIIEGLKQTIADGATHTSINPNNATTNSNNPPNTRNNGPSDDLGRPSATGKDTFKYFFQTEQPATENHEFESLIDQPKSNKPLSRASKTNLSKAGQAVGMFNENILPKFGDQSSISRDASAMNIVLAADAGAPLAKDDSPMRTAGAKMGHAADQEASKVATKLRQKWKTKTHKKNRNKVTDKAGEQASSSPNQTKYHLMSDSKLRSKFQDLMKQNQIKTSINTQRNNVSNAASNKSLLAAKTDQSTAITRLLTKSSSKKSLPGTTIIGDRKFVTKYRDPSLPNPVSTLSSDQQPKIQAIPVPGQHSARDDEAMLAQQRKYLKDKKDRQMKIKQRIKNIDKLQATDFSVASWHSIHNQEKSHSVEPSRQKEKKNFRDMFTKVKVFEFQSSLMQKKMASPKKISRSGRDSGPGLKTQHTPNSLGERTSGGKKEAMMSQNTPHGSQNRGKHMDPLAASNLLAASQVSECIQERYLTTNDYEFNNYNDEGGDQESMRSRDSNA